MNKVEELKANVYYINSNIRDLQQRQMYLSDMMENYTYEDGAKYYDEYHQIEQEIESKSKELQNTYTELRTLGVDVCTLGCEVWQNVFGDDLE